MNTTDVHSLAGAYALDALPDDERRFFEAHLETCASCRSEVDELNATTARLGSAAAEPAPPGLRDRVLAEIDTVRQEPPRVPTGGTSNGPTWGDRVRRIAPAVAAAALIVIVGLVGIVAQLENRLDELERRSAEVSAVLAAEDLRTVALSGTADADVQLIVSRDREQALLVASGLDELEPERTYQLWVIGDEGPRSAGVFRPGSDALTVHQVAADLTGAGQVAVTIEPAGGSPQPTTDPILAAEL